MLQRGKPYETTSQMARISGLTSIRKWSMTRYFHRSSRQSKAFARKVSCLSTSVSSPNNCSCWLNINLDPVEFRIATHSHQKVLYLTMYAFKAALALASLTSLVAGHAHMVQPLTLLAPEDNQIPWDEKDMNIDNALFLNGTNWPCKGYHHSKWM